MSDLTAYEFQLHHTGIKTTQIPRSALAIPHFNCTIQELKPHF